ncbi:E3 ubiquitin-protein ligase Midline-1-like [Dreissena polymorpha]|uniref:B box-type domain-containing protein n=1 Tax=Dreissena polymorpha TaxID=45954 RepID=A0A9D4D3S9_DREPO|nr:E3 ubiquitin-protein ligase Midline-1-like [Dreissena polymorpha]KAH3738135.1 hypothetical protein DPMN_044762 [Dreissena polymorpha]
MASKFQSSVFNGSDSLVTFHCLACKTSEARFYCDECLNVYCDSCVKLHNQLFKDHRVFDREQECTCPLTKSTMEILERCSDHSDERIKHYCEDHGQLCCDVCIALNHTECSEVTLVAESKKLPSSGDVQQLSSNIKKIKDQLNKRQESAESNFQSLKEKINQMKAEISTVRQKLNVELDRLENETLQELEDLISTFRDEITTNRDHIIDLQVKLQRLSASVKEVCMKNNDNLFIAVEQCKQKIQQCDLFLQSGFFNDKFYFEFTNDLDNHLSKRKGLGRFEQPNKVISLQGKSEYMLKTDKRVGDFCSISFLPIGVTLALDRRNELLLLFDQQYKYVDNINVPGVLYDMCLISTCEVAVCCDVKDRHEVHFYYVKHMELFKGEVLQLPHSCVGIACHQNNLYVRSRFALYHYLISGKLVKKLYENEKNAHWGYLKGNTCAVNLSGDKIYLINESNLLTRSTTDGTILSSFTDSELCYFTAVHVTPGGQVLVYGKSRNKEGSLLTIIQVDHEGKKKLATLTSEKDPDRDNWLNLSFNCNTESIIVGFGKKD